jgi:hypothetical protein
MGHSGGPGSVRSTCSQPGRLLWRRKTSRGRLGHPMRAAAISVLSGKTVVCLLTGVAMLIWAKTLSGQVSIAGLAVFFYAFYAFGFGVGYLIATMLSSSAGMRWRSTGAVLDVVLSWTTAVNVVRFGELYRVPLALALIGAGMWVGASFLVIASVSAPRRSS